MKKAAARIGIVLCCLALAGCPMMRSPATPEVGSLILSFSVSALASKTLVPPVDMNVSSYDVSGSGPVGASFGQGGVTTSYFARSALAVGVWNITVDAFNASHDLIGSGGVAVSIEAGTTVDASIQVVPLSGTGTLTIDIGWTAGLISAPSVAATLTPAGGAAQSLAVTTTASSASYSSGQTLSSGYYLLVMQVLDGGIPVWGFSEGVRILAGQTTSCGYNLTSQDLHNGGLNLTITPALQNPITLSFSGQQSQLPPGTDMTVTVTPSVTPVGYQWYLDGTLLPGATGSSITIGSGLSLGSYRLDVVVTTGNVISSGCVAFQVALPPVRYPLSPDPGNRYLVDQNGTPFLMVGDSPQSLIVNLSEADADFYLADRQKAGFNTLWIDLLTVEYTGGRSDGSTYDGILPFTTPGDLSTPNEAYFARADDMIRLAANHGLVVLLDPIETGGWLGVLGANGVDKARAYGRYLGNRYRNFDNIVWISGNDFQTWADAGDDAVVQAVALGIADVDTRHIQTVELNYNVSASLDDSTWAPIVKLDAAYTYSPTYAEVLAEYNRLNHMPVFMVEANYEFENLHGDAGTPDILRRQEYWALLSGAAGQLYGNHYTWPFLANWRNHLDTIGSIQMGYLKSLFASRPWYNLVPDQTHTAVTQGYGTYTAGGYLSDSDYAAVARTPDGKLLMAYLPTARTVTVDMTRMSGPARARWFDPTDGTYATIAGSPFANTGARQFVSPGSNNDGDQDWVLVLETL